MPFYDIKNNETGEIEEVFLSIKAMEEKIADGKYSVVIGTPSTITHTGNIINKTSQGWQDHLKRIKKKSGRNNTIKT
jgi:hypothetical protein